MTTWTYAVSVQKLDFNIDLLFFQILAGFYLLSFDTSKQTSVKTEEGYKSLISAQIEYWWLS